VYRKTKLGGLEPTKPERETTTKHLVTLQVLRRVEEMKKVMEKQMLEQLEKQKQAEILARQKKEVKCFVAFFIFFVCVTLSCTGIIVRKDVFVRIKVT